MTDERWEDLMETLQRQGDIGITTEPLFQETGEGSKEIGTQNIAVFKRGSMKYKVVRENRPVVLDKKTFVSHRQGDTARTEYKLSDTEYSHKVRVFKEIDFDEWEEMSAENLGL